MKFWILIGFAVLLAGCGTEEIKSNWRANEIIVDGSNRDWVDKLIYNKDNDIAIGIVNDETDLYISISSTKRSLIQKILRDGLTVWFNSKGNKDKSIGIRYPIGINGAVPPFPDRLEGNGYSKYPGEQPIEWLRNRWTEFEIIKDKEDMAILVPIDNEVGIEVSNSFYEGMFVYELKFPLTEEKDSPYAIGAISSEFIGIGFETEVMDNRHRMNGMNRRGFSGGRGGSGGARGMRGGRMIAGNITRKMEPLKYWIKVELAQENN